MMGDDVRTAHSRRVRLVWWSADGTYVFCEVLDDTGEVEDWWCLWSGDLDPPGKNGLEEGVE